MKTLLITLLLSISIFGQTGGGSRKSVLSQAQKDSIGQIMRDSSLTFNIKNYGAVGDGITDDYSAIYNTIVNGVNNRKVVYIPSGTYKIGTAININGLTKGDNVTIIGTGDATFDFTGLTGGNYKFNISSTDTTNLGAFTTLSNDTIIFSSVPSLVKGDVLVIADTSDYSFSTNSATSRTGEFNEVREVESNTRILLSRRLAEDYNDEKIIIYKVNMPTINISGVKIKQDSSDTAAGLHLSLCKDVYLENVILENTLLYGILARNVFGLTFENVRGGYIRETGAIAGTEYALDISSCQNVIINNCNLKSTRHAITFGGGSNVFEIPNRNIKITNTTLKSVSTLSAFNTHTNISEYTIDNCTFYGGADMMGENGKLVNSTLYSNTLGVCLTVDRTRNTNFIINNNYFYKDLVKNATTSVVLSTYNTYATGVPYIDYFEYTGSIRFTQNKVFGDNQNTNLLLVQAANTSRLLTDFIVEGNEFYGAGTNSISVTKSGNSGFGNLIIKNNFIDSSKISITTSNFNNLSLIGNDIQYGTYPFFLQSTDNPSLTASKKIFINNNIIHSADANNIYVLLVAADKTFVSISGNQLYNANVNSTYSNATSAAFTQLKNIDKLISKDNIFGDLTFLDGQAARIYGLNYYNTIDTLTEQNNINIGAVKTSTYTTIGTYFNQLNAKGIPNDSTSLPSGTIYFDADGILRRKY